MLTKKELVSKIQWLLAKLFWVAIVIAFAFFTLKTGGSILLQYIGGQTSSNVKTTFNETITLPPTTLCLPLFHDQMFEDQMKKNRPEKFFQDNINASLRHENITKRDLLDKQKPWSRDLLFIAHLYLACMNHWEFFEEINNPCSNDQIDGDMIQARNILAEEFQSKSIYTNELRRKFGIEFAREISVSVYQSSALVSGEQEVNFDDVTYISMDKVR